MGFKTEKTWEYSHGQKTWNINNSRITTVSVSCFLAMIVKKEKYQGDKTCKCVFFNSSHQAQYLISREIIIFWLEKTHILRF